MSKARSDQIFLICIFAFSSVFMNWVWLHGVMDARSFKNKGTPAIAIVLELRGVRNGGKAGTYYRYLLDLDGRRFEKDLINRRLELGKRYAVLISSSDPDDFVIGTPQDSILSINASKEGGGLWGWLVVVMLPIIGAMSVIMTVWSVAALRNQKQLRYIYAPFKRS
ncbi:MAG: hypothetical protein WAW39_21085 [Prosthecobacter sp.]|uniref:hypothetical protein n=1 Tax=Prosthecobacter sp. TaxID=1965333 RepID=UPI003BAEFF33